MDLTACLWNAQVEPRVLRRRPLQENIETRQSCTSERVWQDSGRLANSGHLPLIYIEKVQMRT